MFQVHVGSLLEIYTTMFGWSLYNTFFQLLNITGLIYFPFLMALYKNWKEPALSQDDKPASVTSQKRMQVGLISMILVYSFGVLPSVNLNMNTITYHKACTDAGVIVVQDNVTGGAATKYSSNLGANTANQVQMPAYWWFLLALSSGINNASTSSMACFEDLKGLDQQLRNLTIKDEGLRQEYFRFANECFLPANSRYTDALKGKYGSQYQQYVQQTKDAFLSNAANSHLDDTDMFFIGSHYFEETPGFYNWGGSGLTPANCATAPSKCSFKAEKPVNGWPYLALRDNYSEADLTAVPPVPGTPYCDEWWNTTQNGAGGPLALKRKLLSSIEASEITMTSWDDNRSFVDNIDTAIANGWATLTYNQGQIDDLIIKRYVNTDVPLMLGENDYSMPFNIGSSDRMGLAAGGLAAGALAAGTFPVVAAGAAYALKDIADSLKDFYLAMFVAKSVAPMIQAVILMMFYALMIFYLVMSEYEIESIVTMTFIILAIRFFTPLWAIADYLDASLFAAMYPDPLTNIGTVFTQGLNRLFLDVVLTILYIFVPFILLTIMSIAGMHAGSSIGRAMNGMEGKLGGMGKGIGKGR